MHASHRTEGSGDEETLRQEVGAVIVGRIALITLVSVMAACFSERADDPAQHLPLIFLVALSGGLAFAYQRAASGGAPLRPLLATQLLVDVAVISYLLLFTGGASSPFAPLYLLTPLLGGVFLSVRGGLLLALGSSAGFFVLLMAEGAGMLPANSYGLTERLSESALRLRAILYVPLLLLVGLIGGALGRSLREGRRALEQARAELHRALFDTETILENLSSGLATVNSQGIVCHWNRAAAEILGRPASEVRGHRFDEVLGPGLESFAGQLRDTLERNVPTARHETTVSPRGREVPLGISTSLFVDTSGERRGVIALFQDLSEVKSLEDRIRRGETLAAIGELSAGIAHEIRNCLNPIAGSVEVLQKELKVSGENARLFDLILRESESLDNFIRELLDYARERPIRTEAVDVGALARETADIARRHPSASPAKRLTVQTPPGPIWAQIDFEQMKQVLLNLMINAQEAIDGTGTISVTVSERESEGSRGSGPRRFAVIEVRDSGAGIRPDDLAHVFVPFFSTKLGGTGLGLAIANRIVERHGGNLEIDSKVGAGTTLRLRLPRAERPAKAVAHAA